VSACPVCRASFRGVAECPRCGADLTALMSLEVRAWKLRRSAREALAAGDGPQALRQASLAQRLHDTPPGRALVTVASWEGWRAAPS
jgi:predicted amidophosphoribosyltransferase